MTTATRSVAVVATRLPDIDRRALSQAWFSALHLTAPPSAGASARQVTNVSPVAGTAPNSKAQSAAARGGVAGAVVARQTRAAASAGAAPALERRGPAGELARRIERAIARQASREPLRRTAIAVDSGNGRVHLFIRTDGAVTRIVALCAPQLRERVDRALAHARFALAATGVRVEVTE